MLASRWMEGTRGHICERPRIEAASATAARHSGSILHWQAATTRSITRYHPSTGCVIDRRTPASPSARVKRSRYGSIEERAIAELRIVMAAGLVGLEFTIALTPQGWQGAGYLRGEVRPRRHFGSSDYHGEGKPRSACQRSDGARARNRIIASRVGALPGLAVRSRVAPRSAVLLPMRWAEVCCPLRHDGRRVRRRRVDEDAVVRATTLSSFRARHPSSLRFGCAGGGHRVPEPPLRPVPPWSPRSGLPRSREAARSPPPSRLRHRHGATRGDLLVFVRPRRGSRALTGPADAKLPGPLRGMSRSVKRCGEEGVSRLRAGPCRGALLMLGPLVHVIPVDEVTGTGARCRSGRVRRFQLPRVRVVVVRDRVVDHIR
jgi:hypothetical protein